MKENNKNEPLTMYSPMDTLYKKIDGWYTFRITPTPRTDLHRMEWNAIEWNGRYWMVIPQSIYSM